MRIFANTIYSRAGDVCTAPQVQAGIRATYTLRWGFFQPLRNPLETPLKTTKD